MCSVSEWSCGWAGGGASPPSPGQPSVLERNKRPSESNNSSNSWYFTIYCIIMSLNIYKGEKRCCKADGGNELCLSFQFTAEDWTRMPCLDGWSSLSVTKQSATKPRKGWRRRKAKGREMVVSTCFLPNPAHTPKSLYYSKSDSSLRTLTCISLVGVGTGYSSFQQKHFILLLFLFP